MLLLRIGNEVEDEKDREGERDASRVKENKRECKEMRKRHATLENIWIIASVTSSTILISFCRSLMHSRTVYTFADARFLLKSGDTPRGV